MQINAAACDAPLPEKQKNRMAESQSAFSLGYSFIFMCVLLLHFKLLSIIIFSPHAVCILLLQLSPDDPCCRKCIIEQFNSEFSPF